MILTVNRDPQFWYDLASEPEVLATIAPATPDQIAQASQASGVLPLAGVNGGFMLTPMDMIGRCTELHAIFRPAGWGREVHAAGIELLNNIFSSTYHVVVVNEMEGNRRSRPPKTFGFEVCGDFGPSMFGPCRTWILTRRTWLANRARKNAMN